MVSFEIFLFFLPIVLALKVVVIGGGPVGLFTALYSHDAGAEVVLVEKRLNYSRKTTIRTNLDTIKHLKFFTGSKHVENLIKEGNIGKQGEMVIYELENILFQAIINRTNPIIQVYRGYEFVGLENGQIIIQKDDTKLSFYTDVLVGADGKHHKTATAANINYRCTKPDHFSYFIQNEEETMPIMVKPVLSSDQMKKDTSSQAEVIMLKFQISKLLKEVEELRKENLQLKQNIKDFVRKLSGITNELLEEEISCTIPMEMVPSSLITKMDNNSPQQNRFPVNSNKMDPKNFRMFESVRAVFPIKTLDIAAPLHFPKRTRNVHYIYSFQTMKVHTLLFELTEEGSKNFSRYKTEAEQKEFFYAETKEMFDEDRVTCPLRMEKHFSEIEMSDFGVFQLNPQIAETFAKEIKLNETHSIHLFLAGDAVKMSSYKTGLGVNNGIFHASIIGRIIRAAVHAGKDLLTNATRELKMYTLNKPSFLEQLETDPIYPLVPKHLLAEMLKEIDLVTNQNPTLPNMNATMMYYEFKYFLTHVLTKVYGLHLKTCVNKWNIFSSNGFRFIPRRYVYFDHDPEVTRLFKFLKGKLKFLSKVPKSAFAFWNYFETLELARSFLSWRVNMGKDNENLSQHSFTPEEEAHLQMVDRFFRQEYVSSFVHYNTQVAALTTTLDYRSLELALSIHFFSKPRYLQVNSDSP